VASIQAYSAEDKNIEFIIRYDPGAPRWLTGDPGRMRQILTNLVNNAIKFTERGHVLVEVTEITDEVPAVTDEDPDRDTAFFRIAVVDTGIGIPDDLQTHIFAEFTQADTSTTRKFGGTGLGLTICRQLVELMGGEIGVESREGDGTTIWFTVALPRARDAAFMGTTAAEASTASGGKSDPTQSDPLTAALRAIEPYDSRFEEANLRDIKLLVAANNEVSGEVLREQLASYGWHCDTFTTAAESLAALQRAQEASDPYQLAIMDQQLRDMKAIELVQQIRSTPALHETSSILICHPGYLTPEERIEAGFVGYLHKPLPPSRLRELLLEAWQGKCDQVVGELPPVISPARRSKTDDQQEPQHSISARILLAEDNHFNQKVATLMLEKLGCEVDIAATGAIALEMATQNSYDLILMDCQMPEKDGYETTADIRRWEAETRRPARIPIIAMTAHAMSGARTACLEVGMDDYLSKPVTLEVMQDTLQRWLGKQDGTAAPPSMVLDREGQEKVLSTGDQRDRAR
jgi:CheY-like chemotaxis protein